LQDRLVPRHKTNTYDQFAHETGLLIPSVLRPGGETEPQYLPTGIMLPGFLLNTLLYAAILSLPVCGSFLLRRFVRVKRGLCPACVYPMGNSAVCTECGKPLPKHAVA
jgi:hypothetical protein